MMDDPDDKRKVPRRASDVQLEFKAITSDEEETSDRRTPANKNVDIDSDSLHKFDKQLLNSNREVTLDHRQVMVVMEDSRDAQDNSMTKNRRVVEGRNEESMLTTTHITSNVRSDLSPILEYAEEPLLPLVKACAPLTGIIHNLSFYVQLALNETPEKPPDGVTIDESAAIRLYTIEWEEGYQSLYSMLNYTLKDKDRNRLRPYFKYLKLFLAGLAKLPCVPPLTVWRGITTNVSAKLPPGTLVTWWAFSSCTSSLTVLKNNMYLGNTGERTLFSVETINGRKVRAHSYFDTEDEILLLPGTQMIVQSQLCPAPGLHIIHLKQIIPEETLLAPPFEGISKFFSYLL